MADAKTVLRAIAHARARLEKYRADLGTLKSTNALWFALNEMTDIATSSQARVEALEDALAYLIRWANQSQTALTSQQVADAVMGMAQDALAAGEVKP